MSKLFVLELKEETQKQSIGSEDQITSNASDLDGLHVVPAVPKNIATWTEYCAFFVYLILAIGLLAAMAAEPETIPAIC